MKETLVILAAGMGSRYGGMKQVDGVGSNGEPIIEFTIYDAIEAGFKKVVLIIRKEHEEIFEDVLVKKIRPFIEVEYAYQDLNDIPQGIEIPAERVKPWGTTHALLAVRNIMKEDPFIICNADDYYGKDAFNKVMEFFHEDAKENDFCMVGYKVENTLSDNGTVTRGVCQKNAEGYLTKIKEVMNIRKAECGAEYEENGAYIPLEKGTPVSMNFWGFRPAVLPLMKELFDSTIAEGIKNNPIKYEALLPNDVGKLVETGKCSVKVLTSNDSWFGVTYKEDKPNVVAKFKNFKDTGMYPENLWSK